MSVSPDELSSAASWGIGDTDQSLDGLCHVHITATGGHVRATGPATQCSQEHLHWGSEAFNAVIGWQKAFDAAPVYRCDYEATCPAPFACDHARHWVAIERIAVRVKPPDEPAADPEQERRNRLEARREQTKARYENEMQRTIATQAKVRQQAQAQRQKRRNTLAVGCTVAILASAIGATLAMRPR